MEARWRNIAAVTGALSLLVLLALLATAFPARGGAGAVSHPDGTCRGEEATIETDDGSVRGTNDRDVILVTGNRDVILVGGRGGQIIEGRGGADLICAPADDFHEIYGGAGDDRIFGGGRPDFVYPGGGDDRVSTGPGRDLITDTARFGDDRYTGGPDPDLIRFSIEGARRGPKGGVTVDLAVGVARGRGNDRLTGIDSVEGTFGGDVIYGSGGANVIDGIRGGDLILGAEGDDVIRGATQRFDECGASGDPSGNDSLLGGGPGDDRILGRCGADRLLGGDGDDTLLGGPQPKGSRGDRGEGGRGTDTCRELERLRGCESP